ncbi:unnamed protein product [Prorocentrum cordatum]|uniref:Uncharacterized protein n=1 Tax=Prorocentrum cordatum TaxID=2364126 RepID=A0ABN9X2H2_9DINO|nr:unnamed protein product [Polarella glacialis]
MSPEDRAASQIRRRRIGDFAPSNRSCVGDVGAGNARSTPMLFCVMIGPQLGGLDGSGRGHFRQNTHASERPAPAKEPAGNPGSPRPAQAGRPTRRGKRRNKKEEEEEEEEEGEEEGD